MQQRPRPLSLLKSKSSKLLKEQAVADSTRDALVEEANAKLNELTFNFWG